MELARTLYNFPMILSAENLASRELDELSGMTYLSYFMKLDSPGYKATLKFVQQQIPAKNVTNFKVSTSLIARSHGITCSCTDKASDRASVASSHNSWYTCKAYMHENDYLVTMT